jgi:hypothetical protein
VVDSKPWIIALCRFNDIPEVKQPRSFFTNFFKEKVKGGMYEYWHDISYEKLDVSGTSIKPASGKPWYTMKYSVVKDGLSGLHRSKYIQEAIDLITIEDPTFKKENFHINVVLNANADGGAWGENMVTPIGGAWGQINWKQCTRCQALTLVDGSAGSCHAGGQHAVRTDLYSWDYNLALNFTTFLGENKWRYCKKCKGLSFAAGVCPGGGEHDRTGTGVYTIGTGPPPRGGKDVDDAHWKRCINCQGLVYTDTGKCFAGGNHEYDTSQNYWLVGTYVFWENSVYQAYTAHEMGHCYGLHHAPIDPAITGTGDHWDQMGNEGPGSSYLGVVFGEGRPDLVPSSGLSGPGLSSANLDRLGFMPEDRIWTYNISHPTHDDRHPDPITLAALNRPDVRGYLMAKVITPDRTYTVEFRMKTGWDQNLPSEGVIIHYTSATGPSVKPGEDGPMLVSAGGGNDDAAWQMGQTFADNSRDIKIRIDGIYSGFSMAKVTIGKSFELPVETKTNRLIAALGYGQLSAFLIASPRPDGTGNDVWRNWQSTALGGPTRKEWSGWSRLAVPGDVGLGLAVRRNADGRLEVFRIGMDNTIWHNWEITPGGSWSGWTLLGVPENKGQSLAVGGNADGRLEVFVTGMDNTIWHNWQTRLGGGATRKEWSGWTMLGVPENKGISLFVESNANGMLEAFVTGMDNTIWHNWQTTPGGGATRKEWSDWTRLGVPENKVISLFVESNADGRLEVFLIGIANVFHPDRPKPPGGTTDNWHNWQTTPGGGATRKDWSGWNPL